MRADWVAQNKGVVQRVVNAYVKTLKWIQTFFFFNDAATTEIYTFSLHDALPIFEGRDGRELPRVRPPSVRRRRGDLPAVRSEEHTSELQSQSNLVCRLLLEK